MAAYQPPPLTFTYDQHGPRRPAPARPTTLTTLCYDAPAHPTPTSRPPPHRRPDRARGPPRRRAARPAPPDRPPAATGRLDQHHGSGRPNAGPRRGLASGAARARPPLRGRPGLARLAAPALAGRVGR